MTSLRPLEIYAINTIFDCRFPLPESFQYDDSDGLLKEYQVRVLMQNIFEAVIFVHSFSVNYYYMRGFKTDATAPLG